MLPTGDIDARIDSDWVYRRIPIVSASAFILFDFSRSSKWHKIINLETRIMNQARIQVERVMYRIIIALISYVGINVVRLVKDSTDTVGEKLKAIDFLSSWIREGR